MNRMDHHHQPSMSNTTTTTKKSEKQEKQIHCHPQKQQQQKKKKKQQDTYNEYYDQSQPQRLLQSQKHMDKPKENHVTQQQQQQLKLQSKEKRQDPKDPNQQHQKLHDVVTSNLGTATTNSSTKFSSTVTIRSPRQRTTEKVPFVAPMQQQLFTYSPLKRSTPPPPPSSVQMIIPVKNTIGDKTSKKQVTTTNTTANGTKILVTERTKGKEKITNQTKMKVATISKTAPEDISTKKLSTASTASHDKLPLSSLSDDSLLLLYDVDDGSSFYVKNQRSLSERPSHPLLRNTPKPSTSLSTTSSSSSSSSLSFCQKSVSDEAEIASLELYDVDDGSSFIVHSSQSLLSSFSSSLSSSSSSSLLSCSSSTMHHSTTNHNKTPSSEPKPIVKSVPYKTVSSNNSSTYKNNIERTMPTRLIDLDDIELVPTGPVDLDEETFPSDDDDDDINSKHRLNVNGKANIDLDDHGKNDVAHRNQVAKNNGRESQNMCGPIDLDDLENYDDEISINNSSKISKSYHFSSSKSLTTASKPKMGPIDLDEIYDDTSELESSSSLTPPPPITSSLSSLNENNAPNSFDNTINLGIADNSFMINTTNTNDTQCEPVLFTPSTEHLTTTTTIAGLTVPQACEEKVKKSDQNPDNSVISQDVTKNNLNGDEDYTNDKDNLSHSCLSVLDPEENHESFIPYASTTAYDDETNNEQNYGTQQLDVIDQNVTNDIVCTIVKSMALVPAVNDITVSNGHENDARDVPNDNTAFDVQNDNKDVSHKYNEDECIIVLGDLEKHDTIGKVVDVEENISSELEKDSTTTVLSSISFCTFWNLHPIMDQCHWDLLKERLLLLQDGINHTKNKKTSDNNNINDSSNDCNDDSFHHFFGGVDSLDVIRYTFLLQHITVCDGTTKQQSVMHRFCASACTEHGIPPDLVLLALDIVIIAVSIQSKSITLDGSSNPTKTLLSWIGPNENSAGSEFNEQAAQFIRQLLSNVPQDFDNVHKSDCSWRSVDSSIRAAELMLARDNFGNTPLHLACTYATTINNTNESGSNGNDDDAEKSLLPLTTYTTTNTTTNSCSSTVITTTSIITTTTTITTRTNNINFTILKKLISMYPDAANTVNHFGETPVHLLLASPCFNRATGDITVELACEDILTTLLKIPTVAEDKSIKPQDQQQPQSATSTATCRFTLLHVAVQNPCHERVLVCLVSLLPYMAAIPDTIDGKLPLHYVAAINGFPGTFVQQLIDAYPESIRYRDTVAGNVPLHYLTIGARQYMQTKQLNQFLDRYTTKLAELLLLGVDNVDNIGISDTTTISTPPSLLLSETNEHDNTNNCNDNNYNTSRPISPRLMENLDNQTPLHCCAMYNTPSQLTRILIERASASETLLSSCSNDIAKSAVVMVDSDGNTPLHLLLITLLVNSNGHCSFLSYNCDTNSNINNSSETNILEDSFLETVALFAKPEACGTYNKDGMIPLMIAVQIEQRQKKKHSSILATKVVSILLESLPSSGSMTVKEPLNFKEHTQQQHCAKLANDDNSSKYQGMLPIHLALHNPTSHRFMIKELLKFHPEGIRTHWSPEGHNETPLHIACRYCSSKRIIGLLIDAYPDALYERNMDGEIPSDCAKKYNPNQDIYRLVTQQSAKYNRYNKSKKIAESSSNIEMSDSKHNSSLKKSMVTLTSLSTPRNCNTSCSNFKNDSSKSKNVISKQNKNISSHFQQTDGTKRKSLSSAAAASRLASASSSSGSKPRNHLFPRNHRHDGTGSDKSTSTCQRKLNHGSLYSPCRVNRSFLWRSKNKSADMSTTTSTNINKRNKHTNLSLLSTPTGMAGSSTSSSSREDEYDPKAACNANCINSAITNHNIISDDSSSSSSSSRLLEHRYGQDTVNINEHWI